MTGDPRRRGSDGKSDSDDKSGGEERPSSKRWTPQWIKVPLESEAGDQSYLIAKDNRSTLEQIQMPGIRKESLNTPRVYTFPPSQWLNLVEWECVTSPLCSNRPHYRTRPQANMCLKPQPSCFSNGVMTTQGTSPCSNDSPLARALPNRRE